MLYWSLLTKILATLLADAGVDITTIKRHAGWKSTTVAEGYVENSIENKTKIANQVLVGTTTSAITKTVNKLISTPPGTTYYYPYGHSFYLGNTADALETFKLDVRRYQM
ncbi:hypothetical protein NQ317_005984 [Molorchus minor]|uniref:Tyr recombinase domain-containing protein n=1 Tax=Molorchus minor TaxID=1323400 RepID=A0ABQ9IS11_9CUCU|nr:hypothetical protein NQ317_005984 [Molorchus minor]